MSLIKNIKNIANSSLILFSDKETQERKNYVKKKLMESGILAGLGYLFKKENVDKFSDYLESGASSFEVNSDMSPLDAVSRGLELGNFDIISSALFMASTYSIMQAGKNFNYEKPNKKELINYGCDLCPYESNIDYKNDFRSKFIYKFVNNIELNAYHKNKGSRYRESLIFIKNLILKINEKATYTQRDFLNILGFPEYGYLSLVHHNKKYNNPKFVNQLTIPQDLKDQIREDLMDKNDERRFESRKFTQDVLKNSIINIKNEVEERNINLSLVKLIDDIIINDVDKKEASKILNNILNLNKDSNNSKTNNFSNLDKLTKFIFFEKGLKNINFKNYKKGLSKFERALYIFRTLDKICYEELKCEPLKKPLTYREIVANEIIISVQTKLRGVHAENAIHNRKVQDNSPLIKNHYFENEKIKKKIDKDRFGKNKNGYYVLISRKDFIINNKKKKSKVKKRAI